MREQDFNQLWEEDGNSNLISSFFLGPQIDPAQKEHIKQLALKKLASEKYSTENTQMDTTYTQNNWDTKIRNGLRNFWWRWQWKLAIPVVVVIMIVFLGNMTLVPRIELHSFATGGDSVQPTPIMGVRGSFYQVAPVASNESASSSIQYGKSTTTKPEESQNNTFTTSKAAISPSDINSGSTNGLPTPIIPVPILPPTDPNLTKKITHNLNATLQVSNITDTINKLNQEFQQMGGYIVDSVQNGRESGEYGHITAKIPAAKFESFRTSMSTIGKILSQSQTANDITNQYYDAQTRLQNWEAEQLRYMDILQQAKTVDDILKVEGSLANIRQQIEQLKGQLKLWNNEVDYSTIQLELQSTITPDLKVSNPWQPVSWLKTWKATEDAVLKTMSNTWNALNYGLVGLGYAFPYLVLLGIIYSSYRLLKKRKKLVSK